MKIGIYDPYLDTLGGGEKYMLTLASCLSGEHTVYVLWNDHSVLEKAGERFGIDTSRIKFAHDTFTTHASFVQRFMTSQQFDAFFYLSDGSVPWLFAKKNILLFQFPVPWATGSFTTRAKLKNIHAVIANSAFVKKHIDTKFHVNSDVITPPVSLIPHSNAKKEQIILTVGRFTKGMNMKKQEEMIAAFKKMCDAGLKNWKFVLIGSSLEKDADFVEKIKKSAKGYPIEIYNNAPHKKLIESYQKAMIYWHAAGFQEDLETYPERSEHFGISTVEAMSAGCVPVVFNGGGQPEIVTHKKNGFLWNTEKELTAFTQKLISDKKILQTLSIQAEKRAEDFDDRKFCEKIQRLLNL